MGVIVGSGDYRYEVIEGWGKLPDGWTFQEVAAVAIDKKDQRLLFHPRQASGDRLRPRRQLSALLGRRRVQARARRDYRRRRHDLSHRRRRSHRAQMLPSTAKFCSPSACPGKRRRIRAASRSIAAPMWRSRRRAIFTFPTAMATRACTSIRPTASCFCPGANRAAIPGNSISCITSCTDKDGWVYVADRENHRVQVFDGNGKYETQWNNMHRPCALYMDTTKKDPICYVGELGPGMSVNKRRPNLGNRRRYLR